jgi:polar amino acid transport system substrate-binding protein
MNGKNSIVKRKGVFLLIISLIIILVFAFISGCGVASTSKVEDKSLKTDAVLSKEPEVSAVDEEEAIIDTTSDTLIEKNTLIVGSDTTFPPFEYIEDGDIIGFDIDIINEIATRLDKEIIIGPFSWDPDFKMLQEGDLDLVISAVPYIEEKEEIVDFSEPYFTMEYLLISLVGSDITVREQIRGKKIGILEAFNCCVDEDYLNSFEVLEFKDAMSLLEALKNNEVEAILLSLPIAVNLLRENMGKYFVIEEVLSGKEFVIVFNNDSSLKPAVNNALRDMREDGTYDMIYKKWFDYST